MPRRPPPTPDPVRRLARVSMDGSGATGKVWKGEIYVRGMEAELPDDFPDDGPWWEDWIPAPPTPKRGLSALLARQEAAALAEQQKEDGAGEEGELAGTDYDPAADDLSHLAGLTPSDEGEESEDAAAARRARTPSLATPLSGHPGSRRARGSRSRARGAT